MTVAVIVAKLPVLPVSATVAGNVGGDGVTEGGPGGVSLLVQDGSVVIVVLSLAALLLGSPRPQLQGAGVLLAPLPLRG